MKHNWEPDGIYQNKYSEAVCTKCRTRECSRADVCDEYKIKEFWLNLAKRRDCSGKEKVK